jgi:hypothetical protein
MSHKMVATKILIDCTGIPITELVGTELPVKCKFLKPRVGFRPKERTLRSQLSLAIVCGRARKVSHKQCCGSEPPREYVSLGRIRKKMFGFGSRH